MKTRRPKLYRISDVSARFSLHPQTLRMYEREGLIKPARSRGNTRAYTAEDLERLEVIVSLSRELGVNLAGIEVILNMRARLLLLQERITQLEEALGARDEAGTERGGALVRLGPRTMVRTPTRAH